MSQRIFCKNYIVCFRKLNITSCKNLKKTNELLLTKILNDGQMNKGHFTGPSLFFVIALLKHLIHYLFSRYYIMAMNAIIST